MQRPCAGLSANGAGKEKAYRKTSADTVRTGMDLYRDRLAGRGGASRVFMVDFSLYDVTLIGQNIVDQDFQV